jgi:glycosyltransferase involved in cell wall biosynthesis
MRPRGRVRKKEKRKERLRVLDCYAHQGHQYEFFKSEHDFFLMGSNGAKPKWNAEHRPLNKNVRLISEHQAAGARFDIVMIRSPLNIKRYTKFIKAGAIPVGVIQTTTPFPMPRGVRHVVWNSAEVMKKYSKTGNFKDKINHYIVHGYDPNEFRPIDVQKNGKVLTVANVFKGRSEIMGYPLWSALNKKLGGLDVLGHGNEDMPRSLKQAETLQELLETYSKYSVYLNPTKDSAMPRSRAEAAMCGMPIVTTDNFDIGMYFQHKKNGFISNDKAELERSIKRLLNSAAMREDYGYKARETAIKNFHIDDFLAKWENVFRRL